ncbi:MAG: 3-isopropylmalate dehydrogenase [Actinobacteria bacterium]|nr:3-isopropylmalate dehydrogenase [Actinomycetota bacterium]
MKKNFYKIAVLPGDGIGPEVVGEAVNVLQTVAETAGFHIETNYADVGGVALDKFDEPLPAKTLELCKSSDAVLLGAIGAPQYDTLPSHKRPERGLLGLREGLGLFANLRPAKVYPSLVQASSVKKELIEGIDIFIVRELTGGIYFGKPRGFDDQNGGRGFNTMMYDKNEVERIARVAFDAAQKRSKKVTSVDKANVLEVSQFWRKIVLQVAGDYPDVQLNHMYVDNCAMQLIRWPKQFDVILTGNLFGDILSDEASMLTGSLGMLPSASVGSETAMYEPVHGSAPDITGQNIANPIATIASIAMMLKYSFDRNKEAEAIETAINRILLKGYRTKDIASDGTQVVSTKEMGKLVSEQVHLLLSK